MTFKTALRLDVPNSKGKRTQPASVLLVSVILHTIAALIAGLWIVARHMKTTEPPVTPPAPLKQRTKLPAERSLKPGGDSRGAPKSALHDKLISTTPAAIALPQLPRIPAQDTHMSPANIAGIIFSSLESIDLGQNTWEGAGAKSGTGMSFLGIETSSRRVALMYDISRTVASAAQRSRMPMERIREESSRLITDLGINTRFTMVQFARNYAFFEATLVPATTANRAAAQKWLANHFSVNGTFPRGVSGTVTGGPGFLVALDAVFRLQPETVFILSDGNFQRGTAGNTTIPIEEIERSLAALQSTLARPANIFFIGIGTKPETARRLKQLLMQAGGRGGYTELQ